MKSEFVLCAGGISSRGRHPSRRITERGSSSREARRLEFIDMAARTGFRGSSGNVRFRPSAFFPRASPSTFASPDCATAFIARSCRKPTVDRQRSRFPPSFPSLPSVKKALTRADPPPYKVRAMNGFDDQRLFHRLLRLLAEESETSRREPARRRASARASSTTASRSRPKGAGSR